MFAKTMLAIALGAVFMVAGVATVAALGNMNGDCDQLQLKDGTGDNCQDDLTEDVPDEIVDEDCDSCNDYLYDWNFLYGETEEEPPYQSACGQE
ncbi:MAG: hypothetical protein KKE24_02415 [Candidatus Thermoplasmatota archaeon]|nr:hypothetical protein [Candidatus Thermoplasmatota archaeon]